MSCTHDCGCTQTVKDARTDEWVQIAPESARAATLTPEQPVKALPWGDGRIVRSGGGFSRSATRPRPASLSCVLTEDKPTQEPVLPRRIKPEDVRVGMVVERRKGDAAVRDRVQRIDCDLIMGVIGAYLWMPGYEVIDWSLWLIEDAPEPVDPDAEAVERMAKEVHDRNCADVGCRDWDGHGESTRKAWRDDARVVIRNLRAQGFDVTARAEQ
jgi:hypothetical protein